MINTDYNPDVLTCLANLSNDEVFTPPTLVNQMLDLLPSEIWSDSTITFLDPFTKTGVFLREIAKRLIKGLQSEFPDQQDRINHIFKNQLFGIAITELTSLLSRRSVYCTKDATSEYSIVEGFENEQGNIIFNKIKHKWDGNKCKFCGASKEVYDRENDLETHAYEFIHTTNPENIFKMRFDVIIGNPPYQLSDGGGRDSGAISLYNKFVEQAIKLQPRYLSMIIPARWYSGGKGLDNFRDKMINDPRISQIHDFPETNDIFPGLNIRGGVCYFLWEKDYKGKCKVINYNKGVFDVDLRELNTFKSGYFIRYNKSISILNKVLNKKFKKFSTCVSSRKPFGLDSNFKEFDQTLKPNTNIRLYRFGDEGYINTSQVIKNRNLIEPIKLIVSKASPGGDTYPHQVLTKSIITSKNSVTTETYLLLGHFNTIKEAEILQSYVHTKFFRFLVSLLKTTQNISKSVFDFVPIIEIDQNIDDNYLYKMFELTSEEIDFIDSLIKPIN